MLLRYQQSLDSHRSFPPHKSTDQFFGILQMLLRYQQSLDSHRSFLSHKSLDQLFGVITSLVTRLSV